jgi:hypothetical protein
MTDFNKEKQAIDNARRCQRNWDHSKSIPEEHIDHWIYLATHAPSKQDESFFDLYVLTDREKIDYLYKDHTWGFTLLPGIKDYVGRNPQMNANILFIFNRKIDEEDIRNNEKDGSVRDPNAASRWDNAFTSIGIASGIVAFSANMMGYTTGYGKNFGYIEEPKYSQDVWGEVLGVPADENRLTYSLGIGYPNESLEWYQSKDNTEYLTGGPINPKTIKTDKDISYSKYSTLEMDIKVFKI